MDSPTRKYWDWRNRIEGKFWVGQRNLLFILISGALSGKGGKWTEKNLDKYLKSPADYAPGK